MSRFVGNSFVKKEDVQGVYSSIDYCLIQDMDTYIPYVKLEDYENRIQEIKQEVEGIIKTLEDYDLAVAIDEIKILAEKLY